MICCTHSFSQNFHLLVKPVDSASYHTIKELRIKKDFVSKLICINYIKQIPDLLQSIGYLSASIDNIESTDSSTMIIHLFLGEQYKWKQLTINEKDRPLLNQLGISIGVYDNQVFNQQRIKQLQQKLLDYFENNGYPFARISFASIKMEGTEVSAILKIDKGIPYRMDSLITHGNGKISKNFLYHYLNLSGKCFYSEENLQHINQRLLELPYLQQSRPWNLNMLASSYWLNLYLQTKRANQIDAIAGFLPGNSSSGSKNVFTADIKIKLQNAFASGEVLALKWQQLQPQSPNLDLRVSRPYLLNSPFGIEAHFGLYKKDSAYLNLKTSVGLQYVLSAKQKGEIDLQYSLTNLLNVDTMAIRFSKKLPGPIDMNVTDLVLDYEWNNTDSKFVTRKGTEWQLEIGAGSKKIRKNTTILQIKDPSFNYCQLYDSIHLQTYRLKLKLNAARYIPIGRFSVMKTVLSIGFLQSPDYYTNELYRIGGHALMRGFDEESIYTSRYAVGTLEYRYLLGANSYLCGFTDIGACKNHIISSTDRYIGAGIGLSFETGKGIFNVSLANGQLNDIPVNMRESKIHLGFMSYF